MINQFLNEDEISAVIFTLELVREYRVYDELIASTGVTWITKIVNKDEHSQAMYRQFVTP